MSVQQDVVTALRTVASGAAAIGPTLPEPWGVVVRIVGAAAGAASVALDAGKTEAQVVAEIHRIRAIDTSAEDAEIDALVAAKPSRITADAVAEGGPRLVAQVDRVVLESILRNPRIAPHLDPLELAALDRAVKP